VAATVVSRNDVLRLTGSLAADELSAVAANTGGIAAEIRVDRGSFVRKGDVLVVLDATDARNKLAEGQALLEELRARLGLDGDLAAFDPEDQPEVRLAHASANLAAANLQRAKLLFPTKSIAQAEYEQMQAEAELAEQRRRQAGLQVRQAYQACKTAEAKLTILKKAVDDTTIRAPFDGWIAERLVSVGEQSERQLVAPSPRRCAIQASTRYEAANPIMENFAAVIACP
jgi:multidrug resistance efflux pump